MLISGLKAQLAAAPTKARTVAKTFSSTSSSMAAPQPTKLHGRAFYESLGSPKMILAPMVDRSEFVSAQTVIDCAHH
jgi:hypothetical protein